MPQLIGFVLVGAGLYAGMRWLAREAQRAWGLAARKRSDIDAAENAAEPLVFERDPLTGIYRISPSREPGEAR
jgi:hypothetical protein